jgi:hypothetical protein
MSGNVVLRDTVLEAICTGRLPDHSPERTWGGRGSGACCVICGQRVTADELEFELEFASGDNGNRAEGYHLHQGCFFAWDLERRKTGLKRGAVTAAPLSRVVDDTRFAADEREGKA